MKSVKPRKIILRDQQLIRIRNNLRILLKLAFSSRLESFLKIDKLYREKYLSGKLNTSQKKRWFFLSHQQSELSSAYYKSILNCISGAACLSLPRYNNKTIRGSVCNFGLLDMVWLPYFKSWSCVMCFNEYYKDYTSQSNCGDRLFQTCSSK